MNSNSPDGGRGDPRTIDAGSHPHSPSLADRCRTLVAGALAQERQLTALVERLEEIARASGVRLETDRNPSVAGLVSRDPSPLSSASLLETVRRLCVAARDQRLLAETIVTSLAEASATGGSSCRPVVLVVDDSLDNRELAADALCAAGFETVVASNGLEALIVAHAVCPAVILMDVNMPILNGIEATRLLRAVPETRHVRVIAYTAKSDDLDGFLGPLFDHVLAKPVAPEVLVECVRRAVPDTRA